jgi:hypothetical protein
MSYQNMFLGLVIATFGLFAIVLFTVSIWSARPKISRRPYVGE